jgi:hypothetical protein
MTTLIYIAETHTLQLLLEMPMTVVGACETFARVPNEASGTEIALRPTSC